MNSNSRNNLVQGVEERNVDERRTDRDRCDNRRRHPVGGLSILRCNNGGSATIPVVSTPPGTTQPIPVVSVAIDTCGLCNPTVEIQFSSLINARIEDDETRNITIVLNKNCRGSSMVQQLNTWQLTLIGEDTTFTVPFSFIFSESDDSFAGDCWCTYSVSIAPGVILENGESISISNANICVLAVDRDR